MFLMGYICIDMTPFVDTVCVFCYFHKIFCICEYKMKTAIWNEWYFLGWNNDDHLNKPWINHIATKKTEAGIHAFSHSLLLQQSFLFDAMKSHCFE